MWLWNTRPLDVSTVRVPLLLTEQGREPVTSRLMLYLHYAAPMNEPPIYIQITMYG